MFEVAFRSLFRLLALALVARTFIPSPADAAVPAAMADPSRQPVAAASVLTSCVEDTSIRNVA